MATDALRAAILKYAPTIGANPVDLATTYSYETGGTLDPWQKGPTTQWGQHRGLIQWGEPQRAKYGVTQDTPVEDQVSASVQYLKDAGFQPGMGLMDMYSAVNVGRVGRYNASDANNGGAPGTVADKVNNQMDGHRAKAAAFLGGDFTPSVPASAGASTAPGAFGVSGPVASGTAGSVTPAAGVPMEAPAKEDSLDVSKLLSALTGGQQAMAAAQPAQAQAPAAPQMQAPQRRAQPFDPSAFYALLARKR